LSELNKNENKTVPKSNRKIVDMTTHISAWNRHLNKKKLGLVSLMGPTKM